MRSFSLFAFLVASAIGRVLAGTNPADAAWLKAKAEEEASQRHHDAKLQTNCRSNDQAQCLILTPFCSYFTCLLTVNI